MRTTDWHNPDGDRWDDEYEDGYFRVTHREPGQPLILAGHHVLDLDRLVASSGLDPAVYKAVIRLNRLGFSGFDVWMEPSVLTHRFLIVVSDEPDGLMLNTCTRYDDALRLLVKAVLEEILAV